MASEAVKQKLQRSILNRRTHKQAEILGETAPCSELDLQHEHSNTPPSPRHRDSFRSSSNSLTCQCSPPSDQSDHASQLWNYSMQPYLQMNRTSSFTGPMKMWIQSPVTVSHENMFPHSILLKHVYVDTAMFTNPQLTVLPGVCVSVRQHRPLHRCQSQPLILNKQPSGFYQRHSFREPERPSHTYKMIPPSLCIISREQRHLEVDEKLAVQEKGKVGLTVGEDNSMIISKEFCEEHRCNEPSYSSQLSPSTKQWQRRPAFKIHNRSHQPLPHSSPPAHFMSDTIGSIPDHAHSTGLVYDPQMLKQRCICGDSSCDAKHAGRIPKVFDTLQECGVSDQCKWITGRQCSVEVVQEVVHQSSSVASYGANLPSHCHPSAVRMAAGCVTELMLLIAQGRLKNGFAIVQPHGQEASHSSSSKSGATFNPVVVAAKQLQKNHNKRKILILYWDVHHCDITQEMFYTDPNVLHISLHRYGNTMPIRKGRPDEVGSGDGEGFNINVEWSFDLATPIGDAEYLAAFRTVIKPIAQQFSPDVILISTEFNTVNGHPASQGGLRVSAKCFGLLTQNLMELSGGRVIVVLERGHDVMAVCEASKACVNALLEKKVASLSEDVLMKKPCTAAVQSLHRVLQIHSKYWSSVRALTHTIDEPWLRAEGKHSAHTATGPALDSLSVTTLNYTGSETFRFCLTGTEPVEHDEDEDKTLT